MKFIFIFLIGVGLSACVVQPPMLGQQMIDQCGFHVGQGGVGLQWSSLPVPITLHRKSMSQKSMNTTLKVVEEWNHKWKEVTQQNRGLFEVGAIEYDSVFDVIRDKHNSIVVIDRSTNRQAPGDPVQFLQSDKQGVTQVMGRFNLIEADVFINNDHFEFFFDEEVYTKVDSKPERQLASLRTPRFEVKKIFSWFLRFFMFWKKKEVRAPASRNIPKDKIDFESLIAHELGHVLGLGHRVADGSIMRPTMMAGVTRRGLRQTDLDSLLCGYALK